MTGILPNHDAVLEKADMAVLCLYFVFVLVIGVWAMCKTDRSSVSGFFLAGRGITWFPIGASLFSSNVGSGTFVGLAGTGAASGIAVGAFEWNAMLTLFFLGWVFAPIYLAAGVVTVPEYLLKRFGGQRIQIYMSVMSLMIYTLTKVSADLFSGAIFIQEALGWNLYLSIILLLAVTALYTVTGGLAAVIYTDTAQTIIIFIGGFVMMILSFNFVGGYEGLTTKYMNAIPSVRPPNTSCGIPRPDSFHVFRDASTSDLPWPGLMFGLTIVATWCWCTDQVIVQRVLAAKNVTHAKGGCIVAGLLKILPVYMMVMVGMISRVAFPDTVGCATPETCLAACGNPVGCSNVAYPKLVLKLMPVGLKGLMLAAVLAALMSSLTSVFNSSSTLFTCDLWPKFRPNASQWELMVVGRSFMLVMVGISVAWVPLVKSSANGQLFDYMQAITSYLSPPIMVVFAIGIFWSRLNEPGAFWALMVGLVVGVTRAILEFVYKAPLCGEKEYRPAILYKVHYLHFAIILAAVTAIVAVVVSLFTPPIDPIHLHRVTWYTRYSKMKRMETDGKKDEKEVVSLLERRNSIEKQDEEVVFVSQRTWCRKAFDFFCGLDSSKKLESPQKPPIALASIHEDRIPALVVNLACFVMLCVMVFLFVYYR